ASVYRTPETIWDFAANAYNGLLEIQDAITGTESVKVPTSSEISDKVGIDNVPAQTLEAWAVKNDEINEKYRAPIVDNIMSGNYKAAALNTAMSLSESLPFTLSIMLPSAMGVN